MGADMCFSWHTFIGDMPHEKRKEKIYREIESLTAQDLLSTEFYEIFQRTEGDDLGEGETETDMLKRYIKRGVDDFFEALDSNEVVDMGFPGGIIFGKGGMSYGDYPTDAYRFFCNFWDLPDRIRHAGNIDNEDILTTFLAYAKDLPEDVKEGLEVWYAAKQL